MIGVFVLFPPVTKSLFKYKLDGKPCICRSYFLRLGQLLSNKIFGRYGHTSYEI